MMNSRSLDSRTCSQVYYEEKGLSKWAQCFYPKMEFFSNWRASDRLMFPSDVVILHLNEILWLGVDRKKAWFQTETGFISSSRNAVNVDLVIYLPSRSWIVEVLVLSKMGPATPKRRKTFQSTKITCSRKSNEGIKRQREKTKLKQCKWLCTGKNKPMYQTLMWRHDTPTG
jgi:hypothetical protein